MFPPHRDYARQNARVRPGQRTNSRFVAASKFERAVNRPVINHNNLSNSFLRKRAIKRRGQRPFGIVSRNNYCDARTKLVLKRVFQKPRLHSAKLQPAGSPEVGADRRGGHFASELRRVVDKQNDKRV